MNSAIIQGPLITFGQGPNNSIEGFNSLETIQRNVCLLKRNNINIIIVVWKSQNEKEKQIITELRSDNLIDHFLELTPPKLKDKDHRFKHHYAIYKGLKKIDNYDSESIIIKLRTDMLLNQFIINQIFNTSKNNKLLVSHLTYQPFYIGDFIYAGRKIVFDKFIRSVISNNKHILPSIGEDIGLKYLISESKLDTFHKWPSIPMLIRYLYFLFYREQRILGKWNTFVNSKIITLPEEAWNEIVWRNKKIRDIIDSSHFQFITETKQYSSKKTKNRLKKYLYEVKRYYIKMMS